MERQQSSTMEPEYPLENNSQESNNNSFPCSVIYPRFTFPYSVVLPRNATITNNNSSLQIKEDNICRSIDRVPEEMDITQFTKEDYVKIVQEKRRTFVHTHFGKILTELFQKLEEEAIKMRDCHHEVIFDCPEYFDVDKTELVIREYFKDIGFETVAATRKDGTTTIVLTIT